ncbi:alpha/beta hydrolase family protein [Parasulfitobacter algicola]|uniref:Alpha/beta hydrolase n=1 Tax=Parasulfitobacter algicola TaxID=2614809 RepID=A0ABX2IWR2_9RHOB|nr:alpha/beta hydrolase [Sulfitobacter algicola]NSX55402.1 alpha/beta hydrolase [Sulfitobacter algicola]
MTSRHPIKALWRRLTPAPTPSHSRLSRDPSIKQRTSNTGKLMLSVAVLLSACTGITDLSARPQDPVDRRYKIEEVRFAGGPGVTLAGELTMPQTGGPFQAIVLISGSGPQDRDEALAGHRPFLVLSDHLTRAGFAVLRYDDRGFAESTGTFETANLYDFADDAAGAYRYLQSRPEIDNAAIGYIGHSEGAYIAPVAARQTDPAFMVFLAGAARPLFPDVIATQSADLMRAQGADEATIDAAVTQFHAGSSILKQQAPLSEIRDDLDNYLTSQGMGRRDRREVLDQFATRWGVSHANYDSRAELRSLSNPVLALLGEKDLQVSAKEEAPAMRASLRHPGSEVQVIAGANHLFQPSQTGLPSEYSDIETTISIDVLNRISTWISAL